MGKRENTVETYLDEEIKKLGGRTYKWTGQRGVPDRLIILNSKTYFREIKTLDGVVSPEQKREIARMRTHEVDVDVLFGKTGVDEFIKNVKS
tara:strand:+ start:90 stop:365 length:276 start_codon:yes stop_codon:yes gene_type:complete